MPSTTLLLPLALAAATAICLLGVALLLIRRRLKDLAEEFRLRSNELGEQLVLGPESCVYRGADRDFGNIKGNGVIVLTSKRLLFRKLTGQEINIEHAEISGATAQDLFKGEPGLATGGRHLVVLTTDGNRLGFLVRNAGKWIEQLSIG